MAVQWIRTRIRWAAALLVLGALILAPIIIAATHAPGLSTGGEMSVEHVLHGHTHHEPEPGDAGGGHDATDHEHQTQVVLLQATASIFLFSAMRLGMSEVSAGGLPQSGPRRPPKALSV